MDILKALSAMAVMNGQLDPQQSTGGRPMLPNRIATTKEERKALVAKRQQKNKGKARRKVMKAIKAKNRPLVASKKGFAPRTDGGYGDGPKHPRA